MATKEAVSVTSTLTRLTADKVTRPTRLKMTYEEFLEWADEDVHAEWMDGEVIVQMPPKDKHQRMVEFLERLMRISDAQRCAQL